MSSMDKNVKNQGPNSSKGTLATILQVSTRRRNDSMAERLGKNVKLLKKIYSKNFLKINQETEKMYKGKKEKVKE